MSLGELAPASCFQANILWTVDGGTGEALKLAQEQQAADDLRTRVCEKMRSKQDDISPFEVDFEQYIEAMSQPSTWGGEPELSVVPDCLKRPVEVYMNGATGLQVMSTYNCTAETSKDPVKVLFNGIGHYDLLISNSQVSRLWFKSILLYDGRSRAGPECQVIQAVGVSYCAFLACL